MKKFEFRIFNLSELKEKKVKDKVVRPRRDLIQALNELGKDGWEMKLQIKDSSYLMQRENSSCPLSEDIRDSEELSI